ncbi:MAG: NAD(P)-dependent oxidoreductase [Deltaproteobacteria bacterium]|nr:NAD(P)-dependent oxidoreductase [Deltaproteobacteria bacterium]
MPVKRLLITGASGFLGWNIISAIKSEWAVLGTFLVHPVDIPGVTPIQVNLTNFRDLKEIFALARPDAVIHTAAISDINFCQEHRAETHKINVEAPLNIAGLCADLEIPCLFTSSDLIFDGLNPPYSEDDKPSPVSAYGEQKVLAELGMRERYPKTAICRMSLMFGDPGPTATSFIQLLIEALKSGETLNLFIDEYRSPLSGKNAAEGLIIALEKLPSVIHLGGLRSVSRYEFGLLLAEVFGFKRPKLNPCRQKDLNLPAPRPPDVSFDCSKAIALGFQPDSITEELEYLRDMWEGIDQEAAR